MNNPERHLPFTRSMRPNTLHVIQQEKNRPLAYNSWSKVCDVAGADTVLMSPWAQARKHSLLADHPR